MSVKIKVRVKEGMKGFIYGVLRKGSEYDGKGVLISRGAEFVLKDIEHSTDVGKDGEPLIITAEQQFSEIWMERINAEIEVKAVEVKEPANMTKPQLKAALEDAEVEIPEGAKKAEMVKLLEDHLDVE